MRGIFNYIFYYHVGKLKENLRTMSFIYILFIYRIFIQDIHFNIKCCYQHESCQKYNNKETYQRKILKIHKKYNSGNSGCKKLIYPKSTLSVIFTYKNFKISTT